MNRALLLLGALLAMLLLALAWPAAARLLSRVAPTPTPEVLADCFWTTRVFAWHDANANGVHDEGEAPLPGVRLNYSVTFFGGAATGDDGTASYPGMTPGGCVASLVNQLIATPPAGWQPTTPVALDLSPDRDLYTFGFRPAN